MLNTLLTLLQNLEWGYMLHEHAHAVAERDDEIPRRILPGAPLADAAPIIRHRREEEPGDDDEVLNDTDHESNSEHNDESDSIDEHDHGELSDQDLKRAWKEEDIPTGDASNAEDSESKSN
jgi:hypothetical protein